MYNEKKPLKVHVELSNKCNAMCPQCGRNYIDKDGVLKVKPTMQTGELVLADIKTGQTAPTVKMQLGGYTFMLQETYKDIRIDFCQVIFVHQNELIRKRYETFDCWSEYSACRSLYY